MTLKHWLLASGPTGADVPGKWHPWRWYPKVFLVGWHFWLWWPGCPKIPDLAEYSAEARACGFWISLWLLSWGTQFFLEGNVLARRALALGFWLHFCSHGRQCGCKIRRYWGVGQTRQAHCQRNNTANGANGKPWPTTHFPDNKEESRAI